MRISNLNQKVDQETYDREFERIFGKIVETVIWINDRTGEESVGGHIKKINGKLKWVMNKNA